MNKKEQLILAWSGGKDSSYALYRLLQDERYEVVGLLSTFNGLYKRLSMHGVREALMDAQAAAIGLPLYKVYVYEASNEEYERHLNTTLFDLKSKGITTIAFGDIFLEDLRQYRINQLAKIGMYCLFPLWKLDTRELVTDFINSGFKSILCCINDGYLDESWLGKTIDRECINALPATVDPCGENGEFHTFCYDGPHFKEKIRIQTGEKTYQALTIKTSDHPTPIPDVGTKGFWFLDLKQA